MSRLSRMIRHMVGLHGHFRRLHYSVHAEDALAAGWLEHAFQLKLRDVRYLDIGANHPEGGNNTYLFYQAGSSGVLVEPNPDMVTALRRRRPRDLVLSCGVAFDERRNAKLTRLSESAFNTFVREQAEEVVKASKHLHWILDEIDVALVPINEIIEANLGGQAPHFLSIDAEGLDLQILRSLDLDRFAPLAICAEGGDDIVSLLQDRYRVVGRTPANVLLIRR